MRIDPTDSIAGYPILRVQAFLRRYVIFVREDVERFFKIDTAAARDLMRKLTRLDYVCRGRSGSGWHPTMWVRTVAGSALALAATGKPITRAEADALVHQLVERVRAARADDRFSICVRQIVAIGSYVTDAKLLGDVDLILKFRSKGKFKGATDAALKNAYERLVAKAGPIADVASLHKFLENELTDHLKFSPHLSLLPPRQLEVFEEFDRFYHRPVRKHPTRIVYDDPADDG